MISNVPMEVGVSLDCDLLSYAGAFFWKLTKMLAFIPADVLKLAFPTKSTGKKPHMKTTTLTHKIFCIAALLCAFAWSANANLVADPGFEASADGLGAHPFSASWTNIDASGNSNVGGDSAFAHSGDNYANLGATPGFGSLSQVLTTMTGGTYNLSFWLANDITVGLPSGNSFRVLFGGVEVFNLSNQAAFGYTQFTINGLACAGSATALEFVYNHNNDFWRLDDVSVEAAGVPESFSTMWLALPAFGALGLVQFSRGRTRKSLAVA